MRASGIVGIVGIAGMVGAAVSLCTTAALADPACKKTARGTVTCDEVVVPGRPQHPNVAVDVARLVPRAPLPELRKSLVERIGAAVERDPF